jgi:hypothetical protein
MNPSQSWLARGHEESRVPAAPAEANVDFQIDRACRRDQGRQLESVALLSVTGLRGLPAEATVPIDQQMGCRDAKNNSAWPQAACWQAPFSSSG